MRFRRTTVPLLLLLSGMPIQKLGCGGQSGHSTPPPSPVVQLRVEAAAGVLRLNLAETTQCTATAVSADGATRDQTSAASWSSSNPSVAAVSAAGAVTPQSAGAADITATFQGVLGTVRITVQGEKWQFLGTPGGGIGIEQIVVDPRDDSVAHVVTGALRSDDLQSPEGIYTTRNAGASWTRVADGRGAGIARDPNNPDVVFGVVNRDNFLHGYVYRSLDAGLNWSQAAIIPATAAHARVSALDSRTVYLSARFPAGDVPGLFKSIDGGSTWQLQPFATSVQRLIAWDLAEDPHTGALYVPNEIADHPQPYHPPVFRSLDGGATWTDITGTIPWHSVRAEVSPFTGKVFLLTEGAGLYASDDHGDSWTRLSNYFYTALLLDPRDPAKIWGGNANASGRSGGVYVSFDGGRTFTMVGLQGHWVSDLALNGTGTRLYAACWDSGLYSISLAGLSLPAARRRTVIER